MLPPLTETVEPAFRPLVLTESSDEVDEVDVPAAENLSPPRIEPGNAEDFEDAAELPPPETMEIMPPLTVRSVSA